MNRPIWLDGPGSHVHFGPPSQRVMTRQRSMISRNMLNNRSIRRIPSARATTHKQPLHLPVGTSPFDTFVRRYYAQITRGCVPYLLDPHAGKECTNVFCASNPNSPYRHHPHVASQLAFTLAQCGVKFMCSTLAFNLIRSSGGASTKRLTKPATKTVHIPAAPMSRKRRHPGDVLDQALMSMPHWNVQMPVVKKLKTRCDNSFVPFEDPIPTFPDDADPDAGILTEPVSIWSALRRPSTEPVTESPCRKQNGCSWDPALTHTARQQHVQDIVQDRGSALNMSVDGSEEIPVSGLNLQQFKYLFTRCNPRSKADMTSLGDLLFYVFSRPNVLAKSFAVEGKQELDLAQVSQFYEYLAHECPKRLGDIVVSATSRLLQHVALGLDIIDASNGHIFVTLLTNPLIADLSVDSTTILSQIFQVVVDMPHDAIVRFCTVLMRFCSSGELDLQKLGDAFPIDVCVKQPETAPHAFVHAHAKYQDTLRQVRPQVDKAIAGSNLKQEFAHLVKLVQNVITVRISRCCTAPSPISESGFESDEAGAGNEQSGGLSSLPTPRTPSGPPGNANAVPIPEPSRRMPSEPLSTNTSPLLSTAIPADVMEVDRHSPAPRTTTPDRVMQHPLRHFSSPTRPPVRRIAPAPPPPPNSASHQRPGARPMHNMTPSPSRSQPSPTLLPKLLRPHEDQGLLAAIKFAYILYQLNDSLGLLPHADFYNEALNESLSIKEDFPRWKTGEGVSFCHYPFLLNPAVKSDILRVESIVHMRHELQDAFFRAMFQGMSSPYIILAVRRTHVVGDALYQLEAMAPADLKKQLRIQFVGEEAVDKGGVQKEFFHLVVREICDPKYGMFSIDNESQRCWFTDTSITDANVLVEYKLLGKLIGLAILNSVFLAVHFPVALYKKLMGVRPSVRDLQELDPLLYKGLMQLLEFEGSDEEFETAFPFTFVVDQAGLSGETRDVPLIPDGEFTKLTKANREEYVSQYVDWVLNRKVEAQFAAFKEGFDAVTQSTAISLFRPEELEQLVTGGNVVDFAELEAVTQYDGYTKDSQVIKDFWSVVRDFTPEQQKRLLFFTTGSDRCPIGGVKRLQFIIARNGPDSDRLPTSHTCFNVLLLCEYVGRAKLRDRLLTAIHNAEGFGLM